MRIIVTGAAGFIGSALARRLLDDGHRVTGVDSLSEYYPPSIKRANLATLVDPAFTFLEADLADDPLDAIVRGADAVVHLAGHPGVRASWGHGIDRYLHDNVLATQRLLEALVQSGSTARVIYGSSSSVYGAAVDYPTNEQSLLHPYSPYGATKLTGEHLVGAYVANFGLSAVCLRFFSAYGPGQRPDMAFQRFLSAAAAHSPITLFGSGRQMRDFTYIDDVLDGIQAVLAYSGLLPPVMNLAGGSTVSMADAIAAIEDITGTELAIDRQATAPGDVPVTMGDSTLARETLSWVPRVSLYEGLARQWDRVREEASALLADGG